LTIGGGAHPTANFCWNTTPADARTQPYTFTITVQDDNCPTNGVQTFSYSIYVTSIGLTTSTTFPGCNGAENGVASVVIDGGIAPYAVLWSNGETTDQITGLGAGSYNVTVTDINGCSASTAAVVPAGSNLSILNSATAASCFAADGSASVLAGGGIAPYSYAWSNGGTNSSIQNLAAGVYGVVVTDVNGCTGSGNSVVNGSSLVVTLVNSTDATCENSEDGSATVAASNGEAPYTYTWMPGNLHGATQNNLAPGTYTVAVEDYPGCTSFLVVLIGFEHSLPELNFAPVVGCNGSVVTLDAGAGFDSYLWSNNSMTQTIDVSVGGTYGVLVSDQFGCENMGMIDVSFGPCQSAQPNVNGIGKNLTVYPNPAPTSGLVMVHSQHKGKVIPVIDVFDLLGNVVASRIGSESKITNEEIDFSSFAPGIYIIRETSSEGVNMVKITKN
jgi:hypothetical protein